MLSHTPGQLAAPRLVERQRMSRPVLEALIGGDVVLRCILFFAFVVVSMATLAYVVCHVQGLRCMLFFAFLVVSMATLAYVVCHWRCQGLLGRLLFADPCHDIQHCIAYCSLNQRRAISESRRHYLCLGPSRLARPAHVSLRLQ